MDFYYRSLIQGNTQNGFVSLQNEVVSKIAKKCEKDYKAVKKTFLQIREHFKYCDYLTPLGIGDSHRVKINGEWVTGSLAEDYEKQAKDIYERNPMIQYLTAYG
ncbi:hypothetical protein [Lysinibacillus telephonicus]|uniref:Uncharacterized protein n=1 Tax=Lysinibacillus telephonicus TaxID=1714840 RepID=A0A3S0HLH6_9BACI|nr:hypothetical protein [Lysinibacillus telephonicus]RTQ92243.1 hypothetical protein EKG35_12205 [Lysinibacillus telephonicus]